MVRLWGEGPQELKYIEVDNSGISRHYLSHWGEVTHIALCSRCGSRMAQDPRRDWEGTPIPEEILLFEELREPVCDACIKAENDAEVVALLESKLGLSENDRDALRSFIETVFTDPAKILQVKDLDNRVGGLEKQNGRLWTALGIAFGLVAISIAAVVAIALALAY